MLLQEIGTLEWSKQEYTAKDDLSEAIDHGILVSNLAFLLSKELGKDDEFCYAMAEAGMVHDIGKLKLGKYLYGRNKDTLVIEEMKYVRMHPTIGYDILKNYEYSDIILETVYHHHENYDGSGYPDNLKEKSIPYGARILRTCDVFAALISERRYRAAFDIDTAIELMVEEVKNFDMEIFLAFLRIVNSDKFNEIQSFIESINKKNMFIKDTK
ncbi:MAG: metal dependent phosphohydrolase [Anaerocolumna sp.]|jgi:putative nucleotidyltransferase with HDIG domain|nr:metal dependent phosphohydrolase [Anaerocolumna sp.]